MVKLALFFANMWTAAPLCWVRRHAAGALTALDIRQRGRVAREMA
jgi:hypothetical protein